MPTSNMRYNLRILLFLFVALALLSRCSQPESTSPAAAVSHMERAWPEVQKEMKPWTRWWWMGSAVDKENLSRLLQEYNATGLGGVEIAPIYGAVGHEARYLEFLSPAWMDMLRHTVRTADSLGIGVDLTQGTGWPFGGPHIRPEHAATKLIVQQYTLKAKQRLPEKLQLADAKQAALQPRLLAVTAYGPGGAVLQLQDKVDASGRLQWSPPAGSWEIYAAFGGKTRQQVKRAAPGGEGYTLDHLSSTAVDHYLSRFEEVFRAGSGGVRAFYNDSYEVYGASWSPNFFEEFQSRRGYDLRPYLRELLSEEKTERVARIKGDYRETMSDMLLENFTRRWTDWAHRKGSLTKNQAHGSPGNLLDLYAAVDIPEAETFGSSYFPIPGLRRDSADVRNVDPDPVMLKFASSAANTQGRRLTSCETFTWLGEHFKTSFSQMKPEVEQVFLSGINHVFYHGVTYSPQDVAWPGWLFYASLNLTPANSLWPHLTALNQYITRCQSVLQSGVADNELLVYWPVYDIWQQPDGMEQMIKVHDIDEWLHPTPFYSQVKQLMEGGYSLDFASDDMLMKATVAQGRVYPSAGAPAYQVLIVPKSQYLSPATFRSILGLAKQGATVVLQQLPGDVPGFHELESRRNELKQLVQGLTFMDIAQGVKQLEIGEGQILLADDVQKALELHGLGRETLVDTGLKFIRRKTAAGKYYYLVNHSAAAIDRQIALNTKAKAVLILDPQSGSYGWAAAEQEGNKTNVRVQLQPGEALILEATQSPQAGIPDWAYLGKAAEKPLVLTGSWSLSFSTGGPALPDSQQLGQLVSWTRLPDTKAEAFSGTGRYTTRFMLPEKEAGEYVLDLGQVRESARVWLNGQEVGYLWSIPFQARVGAYLRQGENTLTVEVVNLMANHIRDLDRKGVEWRKYHEINFVNINYQPFDASGWEPEPSGLLGPVSLTPYVTLRQ